MELGIFQESGLGEARSVMVLEPAKRREQGTQHLK